MVVGEHDLAGICLQGSRKYSPGIDDGLGGAAGRQFADTEDAVCLVEQQHFACSIKSI